MTAAHLPHRRRRERNSHLPRVTRGLLRDSEQRLLAELEGARDIAFVPLRGNRGDQLIWAGTRNLLRDVAYRELDPERLADEGGELALVAGCGGWCPDFHGYAPQITSQVTDRFERVVVLPSTFVPGGTPVVDEVLATTSAHLYARDAESQRLVEPMHEVGLAHDTAFFFDYEPYVQPGHGVLVAMRQDQASAVDLRAVGLDPEANDDISRTCRHLDQWLWRIARAESVHTDRAHVMIAAAMMGKSVTWYATTDHKLPGIAAHATDGLDLRRGDPALSATGSDR